MAERSTIVLLSRKFRSMYKLWATLAIAQAKTFSFWKMRPGPLISLTLPLTGYSDYVTVYTLAAGRSCNDIHVSLKCAVGDGGEAYVMWSEA